MGEQHPFKLFILTFTFDWSSWCTVCQDHLDGGEAGRLPLACEDGEVVGGNLQSLCMGSGCVKHVAQII